MMPIYCEGAAVEVRGEAVLMWFCVAWEGRWGGVGMTQLID